MITGFTKPPAAVLDYLVDWSAWLRTGETITASTFTAQAGITINSSSNTDTTATVWLSGGTEGNRYRITNRITTSDGRTDEECLDVLVRAC